MSSYYRNLECIQPFILGPSGSREESVLYGPDWLGENSESMETIINLACEKHSEARFIVQTFKMSGKVVAILTARATEGEVKTGRLGLRISFGLAVSSRVNDDPLQKLILAFDQLFFHLEKINYSIYMNGPDRLIADLQAGIVDPDLELLGIHRIFEDIDQASRATRLVFRIGSAFRILRFPKSSFSSNNFSVAWTYLILECWPLASEARRFALNLPPVLEGLMAVRAANRHCNSRLLTFHSFLLGLGWQLSPRIDSKGAEWIPLLTMFMRSAGFESSRGA